MKTVEQLAEDLRQLDREASLIVQQRNALFTREEQLHDERRSVRAQLQQAMTLRYASPVDPPATGEETHGEHAKAQHGRNERANRTSRERRSGRNAPRRKVD